MPYVTKEVRAAMAFELDELVEKLAPCCPGDLTYAITVLAYEWLKKQTPWNFTRLAETLGAIEGAKLEFYRRVAAKYEDEKIEQNGDVF